MPGEIVGPEYSPLIAITAIGLLLYDLFSYLFPAGNALALAARLEAVIANRADAARVAANGRTFVERERNWDVVIDRYAPVYKELIGNGR